MKRFFCMCLLGMFPLGVVAEEAPATVTLKSLSARVAADLAMAALKDCDKKGYKTAVAVVGRDGNLLAFVRDPLAGPHTIDVSYQKGYAAASFQTPTLQMSELRFLSHAPRVLIAGGAVPISIGGEFYGSVSVAGAPPRKVQGDIDDECARAGIEAVRETIEFAE